MSLQYKLYDKLLDNDNYTIYNPLSVDWTTFKWEQGYYKHYLSYEEIYKFFLIPLAYYGRREYEEIILILNNVSYVFDLYPGAEIWIPKLEELKSFILENQQ